MLKFSFSIQEYSRVRLKDIVQAWAENKTLRILLKANPQESLTKQSALTIVSSNFPADLNIGL